MALDKYKIAVLYPLLLWLFYKVVAMTFGFTSFPDISLEMLLDDTAPFLPMLFGLWVGAASYGQGINIAMRNAFIVAASVGFVALLMLLFLINNSPGFVTYASSVYSSQAVLSAPLLNLGISKFVINIFVAVASACAAYVLIGVIKKK